MAFSYEYLPLEAFDKTLVRVSNLVLEIMLGEVKFISIARAEFECRFS